MYAFKSGEVSKIKIKGISKKHLKDVKCGVFKKCLDGEKNIEECDNSIFRPVNQEMYLQKIKKSSLSVFDDKRN